MLEIGPRWVRLACLSVLCLFLCLPGQSDSRRAPKIPRCPATCSCTKDSAFCVDTKAIPKSFPPGIISLWVLCLYVSLSLSRSIFILTCVKSRQSAGWHRRLHHWCHPALCNDAWKTPRLPFSYFKVKKGASPADVFTMQLASALAVLCNSDNNVPLRRRHGKLSWGSMAVKILSSSREEY